MIAKRHSPTNIYIWAIRLVLWKVGIVGIWSFDERVEFYVRNINVYTHSTRDIVKVRKRKVYVLEQFYASNFVNSVHSPSLLPMATSSWKVRHLLKRDEHYSGHICSPLFEPSNTQCLAGWCIDSKPHEVSEGEFSTVLKTVTLCYMAILVVLYASWCDE